MVQLLQRRNSLIRDGISSYGPMGENMLIFYIGVTETDLFTKEVCILIGFS